MRRMRTITHTSIRKRLIYRVREDRTDCRYCCSSLSPDSSPSSFAQLLLSAPKPPGFFHRYVMLVLFVLDHSIDCVLLKFFTQRRYSGVLERNLSLRCKKPCESPIAWKVNDGLHIDLYAIPGSVTYNGKASIFRDQSTRSALSDTEESAEQCNSRLQTLVRPYHEGGGDHLPR